MSKTITITSAHPETPRQRAIDVTKFAAFSAEFDNPFADHPPEVVHYLALGLVTYDGGLTNRYRITPRGEDLLASAHLIPDDPKPEHPSAPPCEACNGTGERVLFVNMQVCDVCHGSKVKPAPQPGRAYLNQQESPAAQFLRHMTTAVIGHSSAGIHPQYSPQPYTRRVLFPLTDDEEAALRRYAKTTPFDDGQVRYSMALSVESDGTRVKTEHLPDGRTLRLRDNGAGWVVESVTQPEPEAASPWVLIDSEAVARSFVGKRVEIDATKSVTDDIAAAHGCTCTLTNVSSERLYFNRYSLRWRERGNVRLRVVGGSDV